MNATKEQQIAINSSIYTERAIEKHSKIFGLKGANCNTKQLHCTSQR